MPKSMFFPNSRRKIPDLTKPTWSQQTTDVSVENFHSNSWKTYKSVQIIYFFFPEQRLTSFFNDLLFAHSVGDVLTCTIFLECTSYFPYRYTGANQNRCEGILSVVLANIVAVNCTSFHFLIK